MENHLRYLIQFGDCETAYSITPFPKGAAFLVITFFGHRSLYLSRVEREKLKEDVLEIIRKEVKEEKVDFLLGGYGDFDHFAKEVVDEYKKENPLAKSILTLPYITPEYLKNREYKIKQYDDTAYYDLEDVLPKFAIIERNKEMIRRADLIICLISWGYGGAYSALKYAKQLKKRFYNFGKRQI